jgi:adenine-specific DNA-methyltransferase
MRLDYDNKKPEELILKSEIDSKLEIISGSGRLINLLVKGDNFSVMRILMRDYNFSKKIDLVYIDIPFATNNIFRGGNGRNNTISSSKNDDVAYQDNLKGEEFLEYIRERLILIRELMSSTASIYLHIDYKIGHYIKILMDEIFGAKNFRNDISRIKCNPKNFQRRSYSNIKDMVLFYTKSDDYVWNEPLIKIKQEKMDKLFNRVDEHGRKYTTNPLHAPGETKSGKSGEEWNGIKPPKGRHWRFSPKVLDSLEKNGLIHWSSNGVPRKIIYADDYGEMRLQDIWEFKDPQQPKYPTEKNMDFLKTIIQTSSEEGQFVMDCFCGSGSALFTAANLNRRWIGIDNSELAIKVCKERFEEMDNSLFNGNSNEYTYLEEVKLL